MIYVAYDTFDGVSTYDSYDSDSFLWIERGAEAFDGIDELGW